MSAGTWDDLDRELHRMFLLARHESRTVDRADIRSVVAHWIGIPEPRVSTENADRALTAAVNLHADGPICSCTAGNCAHGCGPGAA